MSAALAMLLLTCLSVLPANGPATAPSALQLSARSRHLVAPDSRLWHSTEQTLVWEPAETCVVVCDMWDDHWCKPSATRVAEMAPVMNKVLRAARAKGLLIIHCPSDTLDFYKDTPQRQIAIAAPKIDTKPALERWIKLIPEREGQLPIDDSDGGCDCDPPAVSRRAWSRQHPAIEIHPSDAITDSAEAFYLMKQRGIRNVIVMGVHTNMCVLGRPFSIRQMILQGQNVVLMENGRPSTHIFV